MPQSKNISQTRLDMNYLCALALDITKHKEVKDKLKYYPNSSNYAIGDQLRYVEYKYINSRRVHHIVAVDNSEYLHLVLNKAKAGAFVKDLAEQLVDDEISFEEAGEFISELIDSQLLVSQMDTAITGDELLDQIIHVLTGLNQNKRISTIILNLNHIKSDLENIKISSIGRPISVFEKIANDLKQLETKYELKFLFQSDMVKPAKKCSLNNGIVDDILRAFEVLNKLSPKNQETNLSKFREAYYERYEEEEIPLLQALDTETGIGYLQNIAGDITPLVDDLALPAGQNQTYDLKWNNIYSLLQRKYLDAIATNHKVVELTDKDLDGFETNWDDLPETISAMIQLIKDTEKEKPEIYIKSVGGPTAANLTGRFCHADKDAHQMVHEIIKRDEEQNEDAIFAEIAHLPESRTGNILLRPTLRKYEIPYLAKASVGEEYQLKLEDLYISIRGNQILLRSKRLNKLIIPRLTSAHNFSFNALPVYQFLCDLQIQNLRGGLGFNWGPLAQQHRFLPRVIYKNIILSRASWNFQKKDIEPITKLNEEAKQFDAFQLFAEQQQLPDEVLLADSDNELYLNLKNKMCVKILIDQVKNRSSFTLKEFLFSDENLIIVGLEGGFTNEFVVAFHKNHKKSVLSSSKNNHKKSA